MLPYEITSVLDKLWNPYQVLTILVLLATIAIFLRCRDAFPGEQVFGVRISFSLGISWLVIPVIGMLHMVALPLALTMLLSGLRTNSPELYRYAVIIFLLLYFLGYAGFLFGLSRPDLYGSHIAIAEAVYKMIAPLTLIGFSLPLVLRGALVRSN